MMQNVTPSCNYSLPEIMYKQIKDEGIPAPPPPFSMRQQPPLEVLQDDQVENWEHQINKTEYQGV